MNMKFLIFRPPPPLVFFITVRACMLTDIFLSLIHRRVKVFSKYCCTWNICIRRELRKNIRNYATETRFGQVSRIVKREYSRRMKY